MNSLVTSAFFCLIVATSVCGYSGGAPEDVCDDMTPKHTLPAQDSTFPYVVTVSQSEVKAGEKVQITVSGGKVEKNYKGFLLQVRNGDKAVGSFVIPDTDKYAKTINCHGTKQSGATHKNSTEKETLTLDWVAPAKFQGKLDVYATVAKNGKVYWVRQKQAEIKLL